MKTNKEIIWKRSFSVFNDEIIFPAGSGVHKSNGLYWVNVGNLPSTPENSALRHDLTYHGCQVQEKDIDFTGVN